MDSKLRCKKQIVVTLSLEFSPGSGRAYTPLIFWWEGAYACYDDDLCSGGGFNDGEGRISPFGDDTQDGVTKSIMEKNRVTLPRATYPTRGNFGPVTTCRNVAPMWVQAQKMQTERRRDCVERPLRVQGVVFVMSLATTMGLDGVGRQPPATASFF